MRALAAPAPIDGRVRSIARKRGRMPICPDRTPPLLWQLAGTRQLRQLMHGYRYWQPPHARPYATWPLTGQIVVTVGLTVVVAAGIAMWGLLADLGLVDHGDQLVVKDIFNRRPIGSPEPSQISNNKIALNCDSLI